MKTRFSAGSAASDPCSEVAYPMAQRARKAILDVAALPKDLQGGVAPVYVLNGSDVFFRTEALRALRRAALGDADPALSLSEFEDDPDAREVFELLRSPGLFTSSRMVIVDPADRFVKGNAERLAKYAASPSSGACLVLTVERWTPKAPLSRAPVRVVSCAAPRGPAVFAWLTQRVRSYGKRLDSGAGKLMTEIAGATLAVLDRHLQNLVAYIGDRPSISAEDVADLVGGDPQRATWELTSAVVAGQPERAMTVLQQMFRHGVEPVWFIAVLAGEFSRLWLVKRMLRDGAGETEIHQAVGGSAFRIKHIVREARAISPRRLLNAHRTLLEFDLAAKRSVMPAELLMEVLTLTLCGDGRLRRPIGAGTN